MSERQYRAVIGWFNAHPAAKRALWLVQNGAVAAVYTLYLALLVYLAWQRSTVFFPTLIVPAAAFWAGTVLRAAIDRPRPYTALGFTPLFPKDKIGQSMPSRHCFSAAAIAVTAFCTAAAPLCLVLAALSLTIAVTRVLTGVHYISDVLAGLAFGTAAACLGLAIFAALGL